MKPNLHRFFSFSNSKLSRSSRLSIASNHSETELLSTTLTITFDQIALSPVSSPRPTAPPEPPRLLPQNTYEKANVNSSEEASVNSSEEASVDTSEEASVNTFDSEDSLDDETASNCTIYRITTSTTHGTPKYPVNTTSTTTDTVDSTPTYSVNKTTTTTDTTPNYLVYKAPSIITTDSTPYDPLYEIPASTDTAPNPPVRIITTSEKKKKNTQTCLPSFTRKKRTRPKSTAPRGLLHRIGTKTPPTPPDSLVNPPKKPVPSCTNTLRSFAVRLNALSTLDAFESGMPCFAFMFGGRLLEGTIIILTNGALPLLAFKAKSPARTILLDLKLSKNAGIKQSDLQFLTSFHAGPLPDGRAIQDLQYFIVVPVRNMKHDPVFVLKSLEDRRASVRLVALLQTFYEVYDFDEDDCCQYCT